MQNFIEFPQIDPVLFKFGFFTVYWYSLAYIVGFLSAWYGFKKLHSYFPFAECLKMHSVNKFLDDYIFYMILFVVIFGRLFYVVFYNFSYYLDDPLGALKIWEGGMSFHGGFFGFLVATFLMSRRYGIGFFMISDIMAIFAPIGLFLGRMANFINGELYGRVTDVSWAVLFPKGGYLPRHPSQLYEGFLEGLVLFLILIIVALNKNNRYKVGLLSGVFLLGYGLSRFTVEYFREPDIQIGYIWQVFTMGQLLTLPVIIFGVIMILKAKSCEKVCEVGS